MKYKLRKTNMVLEIIHSLKILQHTEHNIAPNQSNFLAFTTVKYPCHLCKKCSHVEAYLRCLNTL